MRSIAPTSAQSPPGIPNPVPPIRPTSPPPHHAEPITVAFPVTVPNDFSNKANFTNAIADADSLNPG